MTTIRTIRRIIMAAAGGLLVWSLVVAVTGGVVVQTAWLRVSSRAPLRPLAAALLLGLFYWIRWRRHFEEDLGLLGRIRPTTAVAAIAVAMAVGVGIGWGTRIAGGPDAAGYVSFADLLARGRLTQPAPDWARGAPWPDAALSAAPIGYRLVSWAEELAPTYSPGLPLLMAPFQAAAGPDAVFLVVPAMAGLAVWMTYLLGQGFAGPWAGAAAAILLASSPAFLMFSVQPMSDVPAAALWAAALVAARGGRPLASGSAAALAILVRPNLVPLAAVPAVLLCVVRSDRLRALAAFTGAAAPGAALVGWLNWYYWGSPIQSGYGSLAAIYAAGHVLPNLRQYAGWFVATQTPLPAVGLAAPLLARGAAARRPERVLIATVFPVAVLALYLPYLVFQSWEWMYLRFLLPAYPALLAGFAAVLAALCARTPRPAVARAAAALAVAGLAAWGWIFAVSHAVFDQRRSDERYARVARYVEGRSRDAVFVSLAHSGPIRFYTGRDVIRFDALAPETLDAALDHLRARGHDVYLAGDGFEMDLFRERFAGTRAAAALDEAPSVDLGGSFVRRLAGRPR